VYIKIHPPTQILAFLCLLLFLGACTTPTAVIPPTLSPTATATRTPTQTATASPSPTPTLVPATATPLPSPTSTPTLRPTLPPEQAESLALKLIKNNGDCLFPCWFGMKLGETTWEEARSFLLTFAEITPAEYGHFDYYITFPLPEGLDPNSIYHSVVIDNGMVTEIMYIAPMIDYPLSKLLTVYGKPEEIQIRAEGYYMGLSKTGMYELGIFYPKLGIMASYKGITEKSKILDICPLIIEKDYTSHFLLRQPGSETDFVQAGKEIGLITRPEHGIEIDFKPLEKVANIDTQAFYERYRNPKNLNVCFQVPDPDYP
jgi:hypothetical protein